MISALEVGLAGSGTRLEIGPFLVRIRSDVAGVREHLEQLYGDFPVRLGEGAHIDVAVTRARHLRRLLRPQALLSVNRTSPFLPLPATLAGPFLEWGLNWSIGRTVHRWVVLHAAVVERGGRAMIMPAPPGSGKSTLCAALALAGWRLFSDEFGLVDPTTGQVSAVPRPVSLKNQSIAVIRNRHPGVVMSPEREDVEGARFVHMRPPTDSVRRMGERARPGWVVLPRYVAGEKTSFEKQPRARILMQLADQSFNYNYLGPQGFRCVTELIRDSECYALRYSDLNEAIAVLDQATRS
jgi:HprK-related kinase A